MKKILPLFTLLISCSVLMQNTVSAQSHSEVSENLSSPINQSITELIDRKVLHFFEYGKSLSVFSRNIYGGYDHRDAHLGYGVLFALSRRVKLETGISVFHTEKSYDEQEFDSNYSNQFISPIRHLSSAGFQIPLKMHLYPQKNISFNIGINSQLFSNYDKGFDIVSHDLLFCGYYDRAVETNNSNFELIAGLNYHINGRFALGIDFKKGLSNVFTDEVLNYENKDKYFIVDTEKANFINEEFKYHSLDLNISYFLQGHRRSNKPKQRVNKIFDFGDNRN